MDVPLIPLTEAFLQITDLRSLIFSREGDLLEVLPRGQDFWGWNESNRKRFDLADHFLRLNQWTFRDFQQISSNSRPVVERFLWKNPEGEVSPPCPTCWYADSHSDVAGHLIAVVQPPPRPELFRESVENRWLFFQALFLPGFLHNINGPFGTLMGRLELLRQKHPRLKGLAEILEVGEEMQRILETLANKINHERYPESMTLNLNEILESEILFLYSDLFFKHQVRVTLELDSRMPSFQGRYAAVSGIIGEWYHFLRQFVDEQKEYLLILRSFQQNTKLGFQFDVIGEFHEAGHRGDVLPIYLEGDWVWAMNSQLRGLDSLFLGKCLEMSKGKIKIVAEPASFQMTCEFPRREN